VNWDRVEGNWKQLKGKVREQWGELTDDDYEQIAGRRDQFVGKLQDRYGYAKDVAERHADAFAQSIGNGLPGVQTGGHAVDGTPDTRGILEKVADAVTGDRVDDKTGKVVR
jgi:Uncharacterized protein conserved in bacteria